MSEKAKSLSAVIERAAARALSKMEEEGTGKIHDGWTGEALATWVSQPIIRAVRRHFNTTERKP